MVLIASLAGFGYLYYDVVVNNSSELIVSSTPDNVNVVMMTLATLYPNITVYPSDLTFSPTPTGTLVMGFTSTPSPTITPKSFGIFPPTITPSFPDDFISKVFLLSFYDPNIGKVFPDIARVNCHDWDDVALECRSRLADGDDFRLWYGRALACPKYYELGTIFIVISPAWLAGDWICKDYGDLITDKGEYLDFLIKWVDVSARYNGNLNYFPWSSPVETFIDLGD